MDKYYEKVIKLSDYIASTRNPKMKWMWGEALLGFSLYELDEHNKEDKYTKFLTDYCDYYVKNQPVVDCADHAAPGLITYSMYKKTKNNDYKLLTDKVLDYIINSPRILGDAVNHLGHLGIGKIYPKSIWVDSLMMFSVFPSLYAKENNDEKLIQIASRQPRVYQNYMQDKNDKLWYHSYWVKKAKHFPYSKTYWGRGNGWVICALPKILDNIGLEHSEAKNILEILKTTSEALLNFQNNDGTFNTVLSKKKKTYRELSATALIAAGWMHSVRCGYLDKKYLEPATSAFKAVCDSIVINDNGVFMPEISAPTIPLPIFPYLGYKFTPKQKNASYGVAAFIFAGIEYNKLNKQIKSVKYI